MCTFAIESQYRYLAVKYKTGKSCIALYAQKKYLSDRREVTHSTFKFNWQITVQCYIKVK